MVNGCLKYINTVVEIYFEPDHFDCGHCPLLETYSRDQCRRTAEYIIDRHGRGIYCPLVVIDDNKETNKNGKEE